VFCGQDRNNHFLLRSGVYLIQVMLTGWLRHKLPDAVVQTAFGYLIRASTFRNANSLILDRRPFAKNSKSIKIDLDVGVTHFKQLSGWFLSSLQFFGLLARRIHGGFDAIFRCPFRPQGN
jgi:hypothetical protein